MKTGHHLSKYALWHLAQPLGQRKGWVMMMAGMRAGILHSFTSDIDWNFSVGYNLESLSDFLQASVDLELWSLVEGLLTEGTLIDFGAPFSSASSSSASSLEVKTVSSLRGNEVQQHNLVE